MFTLLKTQQKCIKAYRKYAETVAVLSAIYHILKQPPSIVDYLGIESKLKNQKDQDIEPDLVALYEHREKGLLFEFKWSLPFSENLLNKEVKSLLKYSTPCHKWKNSTGKTNLQN